MSTSTMNAVPVDAMPSIGIILTTFNGENFVEAQLDSLLNQTGVNVHIYAFDDQSSDRTMDILNHYANSHPGIFTIRQNTPNSGGTGLNILSNLANVSGRHEYIALADQDDIWMPEKLIRAVETLRDEQSDLYFSNLLAWDGHDKMLGVVTKNARPRAYDHLFGGGSAGCTYVLTSRFFDHLKNVVAQTDIEGVRRISHDWIIYFLARHYGYEVSTSADALIKYRIHTDSQYGNMSLGGIGAIQSKFKMLRAGFLRTQIDNALRFAREGTQDHAILLRYKSGVSGRIRTLLRYRFALVRSNSRFLPLAVASLVFY